MSVVSIDERGRVILPKGIREMGKGRLLSPFLKSLRVWRKGGLSLREEGRNLGWLWIGGQKPMRLRGLEGEDSYDDRERMLSDWIKPAANKLMSRITRGEFGTVYSSREILHELYYVSIEEGVSLEEFIRRAATISAIPNFLHTVTTIPFWRSSNPT